MMEVWNLLNKNWNTHGSWFVSNSTDKYICGFDQIKLLFSSIIIINPLLLRIV